MRLSICIPTYNRAIELRQLLDSIVAQTGHRLTFEVVISDNASTDDTADLIAEYTAAGLPIVFERLPKNRGFDRNILNVTAMASGEYCWLFGSDDVMEPGALAMLEDVLDRHPDLSALSIGSQGYNADLSQRVATIDNISSAFSEETMLHGREEPVATIGPWMGYMTSLIVRRSLWLRAIEYAPLEPYMRGYIHLYLAARMLDDQSTWLCVPKKLVGNRTHNESYAGKDSFARTRLDIEGFDLAFGDTLGRKNWAYRQAMSLVASFFIRVHFLVAKMRGSGWNYWRQAIPMTLAMYWRYPSFWLKAFPIALIPRSALLVREHIRTRRAVGSGGSTS